MHLRFFLSLFTLLFFTDNAGAGGSDADADGDNADAKTTPDTKGDADKNGGKDDADATAGLKSALDKERTRARQAEKDLKAAQTRLSQIEDKDKSDVERLTGERDAAAKRAEEADIKLRNANARVAVTEAATNAKAISAAAVYALIRPDLEFDDDGEPTNVAALLAQVQRKEPLLFRAANGSADGGKDTRDTKPDLRPGMDRLTYAYGTESKTATRTR